ncbi:hypothetical protein CCE28_09580 [Anaeromicrobium sediminis]|uniref:HTH deoR-type domain-containing protein n=1 Tax=Anaeromicrobium sediminis TaxID=1478221 RepID=A0A267MJ29_9FIRM|nr:hypothetical protein CCE28_09580 [Anaeromicrobium sediminis]
MIEAKILEFPFLKRGGFILITEARRKQIVEMVEKEGVVNVQNLAEFFNVSIYTIRRDLTDLENKGKLKKIHGGAEKIEKTKWISTLEEGNEEAVAHKKKIAKKAAEYVEDGDTILLMGSMISLFMIPHIKDLYITVVTNSLDVAKELSSSSSIDIILIGGRVKNMKGNILGSRAMKEVYNFNFDKAFLPCAGVHHRVGITTSTIDTSDFLKAAINCSRQNIIICDYRKIGRITFSKVCDFESIHTIITDEEANSDELELISKHKIHIDTVKL